MATILFTYEFGAGLGHLNRLIAVAQGLRGHRLVFALPDLPLGRGVVERALGPEVEIREGVVWPAPADPNARKVPTHSFADVIRLFGFHEPARLGPRVDLWRTLLQELSPQLIVSDFAPTLRLASEGRVPTIVVGNGYTVPPAGTLLPAMRPWDARVPALSRAHEAELLAPVNRWRAAQNGAPVAFFADLFHGETSFVCTLAEFDPYRALRTTPPLWPFNVPVIPVGAEQPRDRVFAYFQASHPALGAVLAALGLLKRRTEIYVQGVDPKAIASRCGPHVGIHPRPADFAAVLPRASLLIHHAGLGTAYSGLVAGVPQAVLPLNLEHAITAAGLDAFGTAVRITASPPPEPAAIAGELERVLDGALSQAAASAAADLAARRQPRSVDAVIAACRSFL